MTKKIDTASATPRQAACAVCTMPLDELGRCTDAKTHAVFVDATAKAKAKAAESPIPYTVAPVAEPIPKWSTPATTAPTSKPKPFPFPTRPPAPTPGLSVVVSKPKSVEARIGDWTQKNSGGWVPMPRDLYFALPAGAVRDVAFYLCARLTNDGFTRPTSVRLICTETSLGRRTVQRALRELACFGFDSYQDEGLDGLAAKRYILPSCAALFGTHPGAFHVQRPPRARRGKKG